MDQFAQWDPEWTERCPNDEQPVELALPVKWIELICIALNAAHTSERAAFVATSGLTDAGATGEEPRNIQGVSPASTGCRHPTHPLRKPISGCATASHLAAPFTPQSSTR
jgi:hypothetical protein